MGAVGDRAGAPFASGRYAAAGSPIAEFAATTCKETPSLEARGSRRQDGAGDAATAASEPRGRPDHASAQGIASMTTALHGLRVIDFTHVMAGPFCTNMLSMLGAEVIKIESPDGDVFRLYGEDDALKSLGMAIPFMGLNAGKRSISLDLKQARAREAVLKLIAGADIVVENFRPGTIERLGFGYDICKALRPGIIFCSISGYGQEGPMKNDPAIDNVVQATSGMMMVSGGPDDPPMRIGAPVVDTYVGTMAALSILAAAVRHARFGEGQYIDIAMMDAALVLLTGSALPVVAQDEDAPRQGNRGFSGHPTAGAFLCNDGHEISLGVVQQKQFAKFCEVAERMELLADQRFATPESRRQNLTATVKLLDKIFLTRSSEEWEQALNAQGVPCGVIRTVREALALPQVQSRGMRIPVEVAGVPLEAFGVLGAGFIWREDGPRIDGPPPFFWTA